MQVAQLTEGWAGKENLEPYQTSGCQKTCHVQGEPLADNALAEECFLAGRFSALRMSN